MFRFLKKYSLAFSIILLILFLFSLVFFNIDRQYYIILSIIVILIAMLPKFIDFENRPLNSEEMVLTALLAAISTIARIPFASIPNVQPSSSIIIMTGVIFGSNTGFLTGSITAIASNMLLGQGPWTPWQMFAWGMMGFSAGLLGKTFLFKKYKLPICIFALIWGYLYGWIMNLWHILGFVSEINLESFIYVYSSSFYFDTMHAVANFIIVFLFISPFRTKLGRIKNKYGLG